jgi:hypothetical protein
MILFREDRDPVRGLRVESELVTCIVTRYGPLRETLVDEKARIREALRAYKMN